MSNRRGFVKNISAGTLSMIVPKWNFWETDRKTFADHWQFIGPSIQEPGYDIWGASPVMDEKGKVHLFAARWPKKYKVDPGWRSHSEVAHYIGDSPEGPFRFSDITLAGTGKSTWDKYGSHNPTIHKVDKEYVLFYIANNNYNQPPHPANQCTGMVVSASPYGPWKKVNGDGKILHPPDNPGYWNYRASNGVVNPAFLQYKSGFLLYFKSQDSKMGLSVSENLTGPYEQMPFPVTRNNMGIEDGYAFLYENKICLLTTDNHGILEKGGGILWKSDDGVSFGEKELGFRLINEYVDPKEIKNPKWYYGSKDKMKFERPQVLIIDGKPAYLYVASGCNIYGGDTTVSYVLKFVQ